MVVFLILYMIFIIFDKNVLIIPSKKCYSNKKHIFYKIRLAVSIIF